MKVRMRAAPARAGSPFPPVPRPPPPWADNTGPAVQTSAAPPQRVDAASNALGQRLDTMMANRHTTPTTLTR